MERTSRFLAILKGEIMGSSFLSKGLPGFVPPRIVLILGGLVLFLIALTVHAGGTPAQNDNATQAKTTSGVTRVEVLLSDGSKMKMELIEKQIELETPYGKLLVPVSDIQRIEFGLHIPGDMEKQIETAIADLGHSQYQRREAATLALLKLGEKAYPALLKAEKGKDPEIGLRVGKVLEKIRNVIPQKLLEIPANDVVQTKDSKITGRIKMESLKVNTLAFGEQQIKLTYLRILSSQPSSDGKETEVVNALPDPGTLAAFQGQIGKPVAFRVTGPQPAMASQMGVWGTEVYTVDSYLAASAVHAGAINPGETGVVWVTMVGQHNGFLATMQNGVMSRAWGVWTGFRVEKKKPIVAN